MAKRLEFSKATQETLADIEVPDEAYQRAEQSYQSLSSWMVRDNSRIKQYNLDIYLQGSIKLGTAVKPVTQDGSYDVDVVCVFQEESVNNISQADLKKKIGNEIRDYVIAKGIKRKAKDGKRCWTLLYQDKYNFHIDILVAVPSKKRYANIVKSFSLNELIPQIETLGINITDKQNPNFYQISENWNLSNPRGYYRWFLNISKFHELRKSMADEQRQSIEKIPAYRVKTPLQRFTQILKRHAEVMFTNKMEYCPTSIIITTLAAHAYSNLKDTYHNNLDSLLVEIIRLMPKYIQFDVNGNPQILNPVNPEENFADKWTSDSEYFSAFQAWHKRLLADFTQETGNLEYSGKQIEIRKSLGLDQNVQSQSQREAFLEMLPYHQKLKWPRFANRQVSILAEDYSNKLFPRTLEDGEPISPDKSIRFRVTESIRPNQQIYWQVTNTGPVARSAGDLRGEFQLGNNEGGLNFRVESTRYIGSHYVQAFLVEDEKCVGQSQPFKVEIE